MHSTTHPQHPSNQPICLSGGPLCRAVCAGLYSIIIPQGACVLELCASRYSHLPDSLHINLLVGQGMNSQELAANPRLHQHFVQVHSLSSCRTAGAGTCFVLNLVACDVAACIYRT